MLDGFPHQITNSPGNISYLQMAPGYTKKTQESLLEFNSYDKRAPMLMCAITKKTYSDKGAHNRLCFHDLGAANDY